MLRSCTNHNAGYLSWGPSRRAAAAEKAQRVFESYSFLGVASRLDESLVALAELINVSLASVLYIPSKNSSCVPGASLTCGITEHVISHQSLTSEPVEVQAFAQGEDFRGYNSVDYELLHMANARLDKWFAADARRRKHLARFRALLQGAQVRCNQPNKEPQASCYDHIDAGCGYRCLDAFSASQGLTISQGFTI